MKATNFPNSGIAVYQGVSLVNAYNAWKHCRTLRLSESHPLGTAPTGVVLLAHAGQWPLTVPPRLLHSEQGPATGLRLQHTKMPEFTLRTGNGELFCTAKIYWFAGSLLKTKFDSPLKPDALCTRVQSYSG